MALCKNCGKQYENSSNFCPYCGAVREDEPQNTQNNIGQTPIDNPQYDLYQYDQSAFDFNQPPVERASGELKVGMLVWAIINAATCTVPGVIAIILTVLAKNSDTADEERGKLKAARILNTIASILAGLFWLFYIFYFILIIGLASAGAM